MEMSGGQGAYSFIYGGASNLKVLVGVGFGRVLLFGFFLYFCFFYH